MDADVDEHILNCFKLFGKAIGKCIFERIPLNAFLDRTLIRHILGQKIEFNDIFFYDKGLYNSWNFLKESTLGNDDFIDYFAI